MEYYKKEPTISHETDEDPFQLSETHLPAVSEKSEGSVQRVFVEGKPSTREYVSQCIRHLSSSPPPPSSPNVNLNDTTTDPHQAVQVQAHAVCLVAQGKHVHKAVTCAEIIKAKKTHVQIHQVTSVTTIKIMETYEPVEGMEEELEPIRVTRTIPMIHILLATPPLHTLPQQVQRCLQQHQQQHHQSTTTTDPQNQNPPNKQQSQSKKTQGYQKTPGDGRKYSKKPLSMDLL